MGRHKRIDRTSVLDAAEQIVRTQGIASLTIDAVARAAGVTLGWRFWHLKGHFCYAILVLWRSMMKPGTLFSPIFPVCYPTAPLPELEPLLKG